MQSRVVPFLLVACLAVASSAAARPHPTSHDAPSFCLPALQGSVCSDSLRGHVVVVDFWASWCPPCRRSFPWLASLQQRYGARGLEVVAINLDKQRRDADAFLAQVPAGFAVAFDPAARTADAFGVASMPSSFVIGPTGTVLYRHAGFDPRKTDDIERVVAKACGT